MQLWILICLVLLQLVFADYKPKRYSIDLDTDPLHRWDTVIRDHLDAIPEVARESRDYIPKQLQPIVWWAASQLNRLFPQEFADEIRGISRESGLPLGEIVGLNILYDITAFDRGHILGSLGCTSIVAEDGKGRIFHGRNLDYEMGSLLKNITVLLDFTKNGKVLYSGSSFALYNGLLTGQRPNAFTISLNARYSGAYIDNILMEFYTRFRRPVAFFIREVLESEDTYDSAVDKLSKTSLISPSYIVVGGTKSGQGAVISRNRLKAADVYSLNASKGRWFLVETNFDHWKEDKDERRITAIRLLSSMSPFALDDQSMMRILSTSPVRNDLTIHSTVMSAKYPTMIQKTFVVCETNQLK